MGCASSKVLDRSGSIQDGLKRRLNARRHGTQELKVSRNGRGHQLLALLHSHSASAEAKTTKSVPLHVESDKKSTAATQTTDVKAGDANPPIELAEMETINSWELLEEEKEAAELGCNDDGNSASNGTVTFENVKSTLEKDGSLVAHTVENCDAVVAANKLEDEKKHVAVISKGHEVGVSQESDGTARECSVNASISDIHRENNSTTATASKRKAMANDLSAIKIPSVDFSRSGSLRDWLLGGGGQVEMMSPVSYVTPKFGNFVEKESVGVDRAVFDPEMVEQFEQTIAELTMDEESILKQILECWEEGHQKDANRMEIS